MDRRNKEGATLALTVTAVFFIVILAVGLFFVMQMIGGGREAQHATDAGNLNVAKQALVSPFLSPTVYNDAATGQILNENIEFAGLIGSNNQINLSNYNNLVGKAFLVACNASAENTPTAFSSAQAILDAVEGPNGAGFQLSQQLSAAGNTSNFFQSIAQSNSLRMLNWNNQSQISNDSGNYKVGFLRQNQGAPTNLSLVNAGNVIPPGATVANGTTNATGINGITSTSSNTSNTQTYFVGYTPVSVSVNGHNLVLYGVPVRPGLEPHLVSQAQFTSELSSPLVSGGQSLIPPNAFQSQSSASEMHGANLSTRSSAIVGTLNIQAPMSIPDGYIAINNFGTPSAPINTGPQGNLQFGGDLMTGISMMTAKSGNVFFSTDPTVMTNLGNATSSGTDSNGNPIVPLSAGANMQPNPPSQLDLDSMAQQIKSGGSPDSCNTTNDMAGSPSPVPADPNCPNEVSQVLNQLNGGGTPAAPQSLSGLMAIEYIKAEIIQQRGQFDGAGCGSITGNPPCTGLKGYTIQSITNALPFGNPSPTLGSLLSETNDSSNGNQIHNAIIQRMFEMQPNATPADISAALNQVVLFEGTNQFQFLYWQPSAGNAAGVRYPGAFVISATPGPGEGTTPNVTPDGAPNSLTSTMSANIGDILIDVDGDGGYAHPFDCEPSNNGTTTNNAVWTPSSGLGNLLGVINFQNCASAGGQWCCPC
jgi:hypothetical protein